jgi:hypothetical protein
MLWFILIGIVVLMIWAVGTSSSESSESFARDAKAAGKVAGFPVNARIKFLYTAGAGETTEREIHAHHYVDSSPGYIEARCMKAKANRTFRTDRIKEAVDMETGEIIKRIPTFMRSKRTE